MLYLITGNVLNVFLPVIVCVLLKSIVVDIVALVSKKVIIVVAKLGSFPKVDGADANNELI